MSSMRDLQEFMQRQQVKEDSYWKSILSSDTRNIFPKYQLSKIQIAKNKVAKMRLVTEHITTFLSLQIYANTVDNISKNFNEKQLKKELNQLEQDVAKCKKDSNSNDYDFQILEEKAKVDLLCSELAKSKLEPELKQTLEKSSKWRQYLNSNCKIPQQFDVILNERDKTNLTFNIDLKQADDCLIAGTSARIIEQRVKDEIMKHRLQQIFASDSLQVNFDAQNDPFRREWQQIQGKLNVDIGSI